MSHAASGALVALLSLSLLAGCTPRRPAGEYQPFESARPVDNQLSLVIDLSGSFHHRLARDGQVMAYLMRVVRSFFEAGAGTERNDRLLIAVIDANASPVFFEGTPRQFQQAFPTPDHLRRALFARADPNGSRVLDSISDAVEHALAADGVTPGRTRMSLLVLSDLIDNRASATTPQRFRAALESYAKAGGAAGVHWLPQESVAPWREFLAQAGFPANRVRVTADFQPEVPLPNF